MTNKDLWTEYKYNPTSDLKRQIILNYTNLVHYVIYNSRFLNLGILDEKDYYQFGIEGLNEAVDRFDPEYGTKFETYAIQRIRGKILDEIRKVQIKPRKTAEPAYYSNVSLNQPIDNEDGAMLYERLPMEDDQPLEIAEKNEEKAFLISLIENMNERDRLILSMYYYEDLNYKEIAALLNITVSRVSQIHSKIIKTLKTKLTKVNEH